MWAAGVGWSCSCCCFIIVIILAFFMFKSSRSDETAVKYIARQAVEKIAPQQGGYSDLNNVKSGGFLESLEKYKGQAKSGGSSGSNKYPDLNSVKSGGFLESLLKQ
jgi:hypothetical protein